jgi:hypothetical protein
MPTDRKALNRAFWDLGLRFHWDEDIWTVLMGLPDLRDDAKKVLVRNFPTDPLGQTGRNRSGAWWKFWN